MLNTDNCHRLLLGIMTGKGVYVLMLAVVYMLVESVGMVSLDMEAQLYSSFAQSSESMFASCLPPHDGSGRLTDCFQT